jgi:GDP-D-mannose 3', 5'-epimerase
VRRWRVHSGALVADLLRQGYRHVRVVDYKPALGGNQMVTINQLVDIAEEIAGIKLDRHYKLSASKGVNGRNSDNTLIKKLLGWEPSTPLRVGLEKTYRWIYDQMTAAARL